MLLLIYPTLSCLWIKLHAGVQQLFIEPTSYIIIAIEQYNPSVPIAMVGDQILAVSKSLYI